MSHLRHRPVNGCLSGSDLTILLTDALGCAGHLPGRLGQIKSGVEDDCLLFDDTRSHADSTAGLARTARARSLASSTVTMRRRRHAASLRASRARL